MAEAVYALNELLGIVFFADEKYCVANHFDSEAESLVNASCEAQKIAQSTPTSKHFSVYVCIVEVDCIDDSFDSGCDGIIRVSRRVEVSIEGPAILRKFLSDFWERPLGRLTWRVSGRLFTQFRSIDLPGINIVVSLPASQLYDVTY